MVAGVLLGPSLFGLLLPDAHALLFPRGVSMTVLYALSQVGLVLYMFLVGLTLDAALLTRHARDAAAVSLSGILVPVLMRGGTPPCTALL